MPRVPPSPGLKIIRKIYSLILLKITILVRRINIKSNVLVIKCIREGRRRKGRLPLSSKPPKCIRTPRTKWVYNDTFEPFDIFL